MDSMSITSTASSMASASAHSHMAMDSPTPMIMDVVFSPSMSTALFFNEWRPQDTGQYAGTCIIIIIFAMFFRALMALRNALESSVWSVAGRAHNRDYLLDHEGHEKHSANSIVAFFATRGPWKLSGDGPRALLDGLIAGVAYLLMLAVMTMNVGYFLSVIAGTILGSLAVGRFAGSGGSGC